MPLGRDRAQQIEQPHALSRRKLDQQFAHDRRQFCRDSTKYVERRKDAEMRDAQRAV
jgi:hypothetical protein